MAKGKEVAPGLVKKGRKLYFAGYSKVHVRKLGKDIMCDGCKGAIPAGTKFILARIPERSKHPYGFHNLTCMKAHHERIHPPHRRQREAQEASKGFKPANNKVYFGRKDRQRLDVDERKDCRDIRKRAFTFGESFSRREIFDRDNGICHICKLPVDFSKSGHYPTAPTIDHIIAIDNGGPHARDNVACAHWHCNAVKAAREWLYVHEVAACQAKVRYHARQSA